MWAFTTFAVAASTLGANALNLVQPRDATAPKVIQHEIERRHVENPVARDRARAQAREERLRRRQDNTVQETLDNQETLYFMNITIGTPGQDLRMHIDTGSSDLWVNTPSSDICDGTGQYAQYNYDICADSGTYAPNKSSTYEYVNDEFNISYVDGTGASGDYVKDVVKFGGVSLEGQQFAIGYTSSSSEGVLGIGYPINEVAVAYNGGNPYPNIPVHLVNDGHINTNAYSLWLNDLDASTGSILFGGVNTEKFEGTLAEIPIVQENGYYAEFIIALTAMGTNGDEGSIFSDQAIPALLDSGSSLMYLPTRIANALYDGFNAEYDESQGTAFVDCSLANSDTTLEFTFSGVTISVAMNELVIVAGYSSRGIPACILGISPTSSTPVLGDTFLRSAYVVYNIAGNEIAMAQTNFNSTSDNILEITETTSVPSATAVANAVTDVAVSSEGARIDSPSGFASSFPSSSSSEAFAMPTAAPGYDFALLGAAGAGLLFAL
ncbi:acid protease [Hortaea werneckii]|nr:acid protease [Hortaea werneckii]KAI7096764.1 acid protease [Hortaea werneckii]KAI7308456.1 acid protease [Hortaea werneckii]KAI7385860.1 acid protease [Hortaea werneckii]